MDLEQKETLARTRDDSAEASAVRMKAVRFVAGLSQDDLALEVGLTKGTISGIEKGKSFPGRDLMKYFYRSHRIDFNFMITGEFSQLPSDVQDRLFEKLQDVERGADRVSSSN